MNRLAFILGTRPEIVKLSPIIRECVRKKIKFIVIHSNQHYSPDMDAIFFKELKLPQPNYNLKVGSGTHGVMTAKIISQLEPILLKENPNWIIVQGDTNTVLASALTATKLHIKVAHVEAGLRSYDRSMPEEINRILTDHISDILFCPTKNQAKILINEGIENNKIAVVGNTIVDAVYQNYKIAEKHKKYQHYQKERYFLLTMHRPSNVDTKSTLEKVINNLESLSNKFNMPIYFPIHPRTKNQINKFKIKLISKHIKIVPPVGFLEMLIMEKCAKLILTDSGGIQEEACILQVPCLTLRENTERPETLKAGANILVGSDKNKLIISTSKQINKKRIWKNPFGNGKSSAKIINYLFNN